MHRSERSRPRATPHPRLGDLITREREIVSLVAEGLTSHEIAARLVVSPATCRTPRSAPRGMLPVLLDAERFPASARTVAAGAFAAPPDPAGRP